MNLSEATKSGISRLRRPMWANKNAYIKIDLLEDGFMGPWMHLYDRPMQDLLGESTPQSFFASPDTVCDYIEYSGELDNAENPV